MRLCKFQNHDETFVRLSDDRAAYLRGLSPETSVSRFRSPKFGFWFSGWFCAPVLYLNFQTNPLPWPKPLLSERYSGRPGPGLRVGIVFGNLMN